LKVFKIRVLRRIFGAEGEVKRRVEENYVMRNLLLCSLNKILS
jgi:hypothetical protein